MSKSQQAFLREQRLAEKLRENLKRRKTQSRARQDEPSHEGAASSNQSEGSDGAQE